MERYGQRSVSTIAAQRTRSAGRVGRRVEKKPGGPLQPKEKRQLVRLVLCGSAFILLVAVKLLLPEKSAALQTQLAAAMEKNMDVQAVFSAVGDAFAVGETTEETVRDVYRAVFQPEDVQALETSAWLAEGEISAGAMEELQAYRLAVREEMLSAEPEPEPEPTEEAQTELAPISYVLYSEQNLPANATMEQAILSFAYTTPVKGAVSSPFGYREHPVEGEERFHYGLDIAADTGSSILSFADGTVRAVGESSSYGKYCIVEHEGGYETLYAHCSRINISSGTAVQRGEKIAEVGETGIATGPHLHFELIRDGTYLNAIYYVSCEST